MFVEPTETPVVVPAMEAKATPNLTDIVLDSNQMRRAAEWERDNMPENWIPF